MANVYPKAVYDRLSSPRNAGHNDHTKAVGKSVALECGTFVAVKLSIEIETKLIEKITFNSNGCGFMVAAADVLAGEFSGRYLTELGALTDQPRAIIYERLGEFPPERQHCVDAVVTAFKGAFADFRRGQIEEFAGEKALICTCFGITEEAIESTIRSKNASTVEHIGQICRAGTGCGSCQMMIQEIIDSMTDDG